jgi:serine/threonine protein kinase/Tfp pilus assembly protein PilF
MATMSSPVNHLYEFGPFRLDPQRRILLHENDPVALTPKAVETLVVLVENRDRVLSKDELMKMLWPDSFVEESNLSQNIFILRKALGDSTQVRRYILTVQGKGYQFVAAVEEIGPPKVAPAVETQEVSSPDNLIGKKVSHYRVLEVLGGGGMGIVYRAEDLKLGRRVAMKFLPSELASDPKAFERMQREARAASSLDHPNICAIYEFGEHEGQPFIVMQLLEGQTLREWIESAPKAFSRERLSRIEGFAVQVADGLEAAHQKGIIHRDIKPANIFITNRGDAKILDFGVAKFVDGVDLAEAKSSDPLAGDDSTRRTADLHLTRTGDSLGTPFYLSPEQIRREKLDARTDLFSFGLVLYEMVTGQRAFSGNNTTVIRNAVLNSPCVPLRHLNPEVPVEFERIVERALEKELDRRYQSAHEMRVDLERLRAAAPPSRLTHNQSWWWIATGIAVVALILLALNVGGVRERWFHRTRTSDAARSQATVAARPSVAVLGFKNLSGKDDKAWISTALSEMLGAQLAAGQQLRVVPGENVARMKLDLSLSPADSYGPDTLTKIRGNLSTDMVVLGSYLAVGKDGGGKIRIDLQMQDTRAGETIAVVSRDGAESDLADLASQSGTGLRQKLGIGDISANDARLARAATAANLEAARLYAEGLAKLQTYDALAARDLLQKAVAADPSHALSHAALSQAWFALGYDAKAQEEAKKAFDLSANLSREERLSIEGRYRRVSNDFPAAIEIYRTLYNFFPDSVDYGLSLAMAQSASGQPKEALETISRIRNSRQPQAMGADVDVTEANVYKQVSDYKREQETAASAVLKGKAQGAALIVAAARLEESWAWDHLGDLQKAMDALVEARDLSQGRNPRTAAQAQLNIGHVYYDKGDFAQAQNSYEQALKGYREIGDQEGVTRGLEAVANVLYEQQKQEEAKQNYEEELRISRQIGYKRGMLNALGGLGNLLDEMGDLPGAARADEQAMLGFRENGNKRAEATAMGNWGIVLMEQGDLAAAKTKTEGALKLQREVGYKRGVGFSFSILAEISRLQDHLDEAYKTAEQATAVRKEIGDESNGARSQKQLAQITLDQGRAADAEGLARASADASTKLQIPENQAQSNAVLAEALLAQGKIKDAQAAADHAMALGQKADRPSRFESVLASADVNAALGKFVDAAKEVETVRAEASRYGFLSYDLESRLRLAQLELRSGKAPAGRARLQQLQSEARNKGFLLIARKANFASKSTVSGN